MSFKGFNEFKFDFTIENMWVRTVDASRGLLHTDFPRHMHPIVELHLIIAGKGELVLDDARYDLSEGDLFFTGPKVYHTQLTDPKDNMQEYCLMLEFLPTDKSKLNEIAKFFLQKNFYICKDKHGIKFLFEEIEKETSLQQVGFISIVCSLLQTILLKTARNYFQETEKTKKSKKSEERRHLLLDEAFLYSYKTVTLQSLADLLHLDVRQIQRIIFKRYGISFIELRTQSRLSVAQKMIDNNEGTLLEIAEKCGYDNYAYFAKLFKKRFGVLPSEYRKKDKN